MVKDKTVDQRQARYRDAQAERGLKLVKVWVPEGSVESLKLIAADMRRLHQGEV